MLTRLQAQEEIARAQEERERSWDVLGQPELLRQLVEYPSAGPMRLVSKELRDAFDSTVKKLTWREPEPIWNEEFDATRTYLVVTWVSS